MAQSSRIRRRHSKSDQSNGSKKRSAQSKQLSRASKKHKNNNYEEEEAAVEAGQAEEELFKVEKIVGSKLDKNGASLYKTRWKGYSAGDDTWEPRENVASTGHVDRYERRQRQRTLRKASAGVAVIEYEDGEREMVDMKIEKFRGYRPDSSDDERDDDTDDGDADVNDFKLVAEGQWIEILWRYTNMYFPCKIIFWTPMKPKAKKSHKKGAGESLPKESHKKGVEDSSSKKSHKKGARDYSPKKSHKKGAGDSSPKKSHKKGAGNVSRKGGFEDVEESSAVQSKHNHLKRTSKSKRGDDKTSRAKRQLGSVVTAEPAKNSHPEPALNEPTQHFFRRNERESKKKMLEAGVKEKDCHDSDDHSINSESSGISDDSESDSERPVERVGHGIPLFNEPEDDFDSSDDESDEDEEGEGTHVGQYPFEHEGPKLSFEDLWTLKLKRTQELMDRG